MTDPARLHDLVERRRRAVEMRNQRPPIHWQTIADELGYASKGAACTDVTRALAQHAAGLAANIEEHRATELERLAHLEELAMEVALSEHPVVQGGEIVEGVVDQGPVLRAIQTVLRVAERRARLLGLDSPARVQVEGVATVRHVLEGVDVEGL